MSALKRSEKYINGLTTKLAALALADSAEKSRAEAAEAAILNTVDGLSLTLSEMINDVSRNSAKTENNLSDLVSATAARANLSVNSIAEVDAKIVAAKLALGTRHSVNNIAGRDALADLDLADSVYVTDNGDGKWAIYQPSAVDGSGHGTAWVVLADEDTYLNANSKEAIKAAYESNPNTNPFSDAEKDKLGLLIVTTPKDLDKVVLTDQLVADLSQPGLTNAQVPGAAAVKAFALAAASSGGAMFNTESLVVASDKIILSFKPKDGMVLNFGAVRITDGDTGAADDVYVTVDNTDASGKTYTILSDVAGEFNGKSAVVQYPYTL